jgi:hypothetical protein
MTRRVRSIYELVDPETAEVRAPAQAGTRVATTLDATGCRAHRWRLETPALAVCVQCPTSVTSTDAVGYVILAALGC